MTQSHQTVEHNHKNCSHSHDHSKGQSHDHNHGNLPVVLFFAGLATFIISLFLPTGTPKTILALATIVLSGYHIMMEGFEDTINETKKLKKFTPNVHVLMSLAAIGAAIIGDYTEGALLILIFAAAHFLEHYVENKSKKEITSLMKMNGSLQLNSQRVQTPILVMI